MNFLNFMNDMNDICEGKNYIINPGVAPRIY